jgi:futalosine hydrolase
MPADLVLVPTAMERALLQPHLDALPGPRPRVALCGFGVAAAAARTAALLARHAPGRVILVGIAGRYDGGPAIGEAAVFPRVACHGIGAGSGAAFVTAGALGWPQWPGDPPDAACEVGDTIDLGADSGAGGTLLTVTAAAASADDVGDRRRRFPEAVAEDMEGFGVALACRLAGVPCGIVRGISNTAGDRDAARWVVRGALDAAAALVAGLLAGDRP